MATKTTKSQQQKLFNYLRRNGKITEQGWEIESVRNPKNPRTVTYVVNSFM
jgi:hypothetical protein